MKKKCVALLLAGALCVSMFSTTALAAEADSAAGSNAVQEEIAGAQEKTADTQKGIDGTPEEIPGAQEEFADTQEEIAGAQ